MTAPVGSSDASSQKSLKKSVEKAKKALQKEEKLANDKKIAHANGKVLHCDDQKRKNFVCSAAAIDSPAKRVVVTAAHCVYAEKNRCFSNWVFIPGYDNGKKPYGTFQAQHSHALRDYIHRGDDAGSDWNSDVAFVTAKDSEQGRRLVDAVGGHKVVTGKTTEFNANIFGCPHNLDRGRTLQTRSKRTKDAWVNRKRRFHTVTGCDLREGVFWRASFRRSREEVA